MTYVERIPAAWRELLGNDVAKLDGIEAFVASQRAILPDEIHPREEEVFKALVITLPADVRVVIVGMDPYHGPDQAMGLAFSLRPEAMPFPPSLKNILTELERDLGHPVDRSGDLAPWASRGVLLLNRALTVRRRSAGSHLREGEPFTRSLVDGLVRRSEPVLFMLWGKKAQAVAGSITGDHGVQIRSHPSPFSSRVNFKGTRPFDDADRWLRANGGGIDWSH